MRPEGFAFRDLILPLPQTVPLLEGSIFPIAQRDHQHVPGAEAEGGTARYGDLNGFVWYYSGGMLTLNRGMKRIRRTVRGVEDVARRRG